MYLSIHYFHLFHSFLKELLPNPPHVSNIQYTVIVADADSVGLYVKEIVATSRDENNNVVQTSGVIDTGMTLFYLISLFPFINLMLFV